MDVRRRKADTGQSGHLVDCRQKVGERGKILCVSAVLPRFCDSVSGDVLPQQKDFPRSCIDEPFDFLHDGGNRTAFLAPSCVRDDAVGTELVTAAHDGDFRDDGAKMMAIQFGADDFVQLRFSSPTSRLNDVFDDFRHTMQLIRSRDEIKHRKIFK